MKLGLFGINFGVCADPDVAVRVARAAEAAGFESVWTGEHVVLPEPQAPPSPSPPETPFLDPAVALTFVAAHTANLRLGTGIIILPQRNPVVLAKELTSVDRLSKGRLIFGLGATKSAIAGLRAAEQRGRPAGLGKLEISVTPPPRMDVDTVKRYAELGVDRLVLYPTGRPDDLVAFVEKAARDFA
jgi:hypothetical protein